MGKNNSSALKECVDYFQEINLDGIELKLLEKENKR